MCAYSQSYHALPHCKCVSRCRAKCPSINILDQETDDQYHNTIPSISFHIYHLIVSCTKHGRLPLTDNISCCKCQQDTFKVQSTKIYTRKELLMTETTISKFSYKFLYSSNPKVGVSHYTRTNIGYKSLWRLLPNCF